MVYRKSTLAVLLALIFLSFFGTLTLSASMFPQNYDWRYRVISNLLSPRDNPDCYWIAALGLGLSGALMLPFAGYLRHSLGMIAPRMAKVTATAFVLGIIALICACVVLPQHTHKTLGMDRRSGYFSLSLRGSLSCSRASSRNGAFAHRGLTGNGHFQVAHPRTARQCRTEATQICQSARTQEPYLFAFKRLRDVSTFRSTWHRGRSLVIRAFVRHPSFVI